MSSKLVRALLRRRPPQVLVERNRHSTSILGRRQMGRPRRLTCRPSIVPIARPCSGEQATIGAKRRQVSGVYGFTTNTAQPIRFGLRIEAMTMRGRLQVRKGNVQKSMGLKR